MSIERKRPLSRARLVLQVSAMQWVKERLVPRTKAASIAVQSKMKPATTLGAYRSHSSLRNSKPCRALPKRKGRAFERIDMSRGSIVSERSKQAIVDALAHGRQAIYHLRSHNTDACQPRLTFESDIVFRTFRIWTSRFALKKA